MTACVATLIAAHTTFSLIAKPHSVHTRTHFMRTHLHADKHMRPHMHTQTLAHTHTHAHTHVHAYTHTHTGMLQLHAAVDLTSTSRAAVAQPVTSMLWVGPILLVLTVDGRVVQVGWAKGCVCIVVCVAHIIVCV